MYIYIFYLSSCYFLFLFFVLFCRYTPTEVLRLLDLLSSWLEEYPSREVVIISGGSMNGFQSTIYCNLLDENGNLSGDSNDDGGGGGLLSTGNRDNNNMGSADSFASMTSGKASCKIVQICVGAVVGHIGDLDVPLSDELYSVKRRFLFEHFNPQSKSHVGVVEIESKQFESWDYANTKFMDRFQLNVASVKWSLLNIDNNNSKTANELPPNLLLASTTSHMLPTLWRVVKGHIQYFHLNRDIILHEPNRIPKSVDKRALLVIEGVSRVFISQDSIWRRIHAVLKKSRYFDMAFSQGTVLTHNIISIFVFVFNNLAETDVFHVPSSFVIRKVWEKFTIGYIHIEAAKHSSDTAITPETVLAGCESVVANLTVDVDYFIKFMRQIMEVQILLEYFSASMGNFD